MEKRIVLNQYDKEVDFEVAVNLMDDELREQIHQEFAPCTEQEFYNRYCKEHHNKFGEEFVIDMENGQY